MIDRRVVIGAGMGIAAGAAKATGAAAAAGPSWPPPERFRLWPGTAPGAPARLPALAPVVTGGAGEYHDYQLHGVAAPEVGVFRPRRPNGIGVLVCPGGGYMILSVRNEGIDVAAALNPAGITVFVLIYRLPGEGWANPALTPLADAQRAMRLIRARAPAFGVDPAKLGVLGFSAGGHLAGTLTVHHDLAAYDPVDAADRQPARPAFTGMCYAVGRMDGRGGHEGSRRQLLGPAPTQATAERFTVARQLTPATPPLWAMHCADDTTVPASDTLDLAAAADALKLPAETHVFRDGGHGFGTRAAADSTAALWPDLFARWVKRLP